MTPRHERGRRGRGEHGETLIELLLALVLMGIGFLAVLSGIGTSIIGTSAQHTHTVQRIALQNAAELLSDPTGYAPCASTYAVPSQPDSPDATVVVVSVQSWDGAGFLPPGAPCTDHGLQLITLSASSAGDCSSSDACVQVTRRAP